MHTHTLVWSSVAVVALSTGALAFTRAVQEPAPEPPAATSGLRRVAAPQQAEAQPESGLKRRGSASPRLVEPFPRAEWERRLLEPDLAQRELDFEALLEEARRNPAARAFLEECSAAEGELGWTARLGLRELRRDERGRFGWGTTPFGAGAPGGTPFGQELRAWLDELEQGFGSGAWGALGAPPTWLHVPGQGLQGQSQSYSLQVGPEGVKVEIAEEVDGERELKTYEAPSLDELLREHPELAERIGTPLPDSRVDSFRSLFRFAPEASPDSAFELLVPRALQSTPAAPGVLRTDVLGVYTDVLSAERRAELHLDAEHGVLVKGTMAGTIASQLGLAAGDVVVEINGQEIRSADDIGKCVRARAADQELRVTWFDGWGRQHTRTWRPGGLGEAAEAQRER